MESAMREGISYNNKIYNKANDEYITYHRPVQNSMLIHNFLVLICHTNI